VRLAARSWSARRAGLALVVGPGAQAGGARSPVPRDWALLVTQRAAEPLDLMRELRSR
jgi:hypothetical protein